MELQIRGRNVEVTDQVRNHLEQKMGQITRHLPGLSRITVDLASEPTRTRRDRVVAQVTVDVGGSVLRAEQRGANTQGAINSAAEVLTRRIERYKSQAYRSERAKQGPPLRDRQPEEAALDGGSTVTEELTDGDLVKIKRFDMAPMTVQEAAFRMQLLGHRFFMFFNSDSATHNVLYQRDDGNYGLIQPAGCPPDDGAP